jgi:quercetin dioxygenase-like cupin family protein
LELVINKGLKELDMWKFVLADWKERVVFSENGPQPQILEENGLFKVILAGLEPGQSIPVHSELGAVYYILQGDGWMTVDEERFSIEAGAVIGMGNGAARGIEAKTQLAFLAVRTGAA